MVHAHAAFVGDSATFVVVGIRDGAGRGACDGFGPFLALCASSAVPTRDIEARSAASSTLSESLMLGLFSSEEVGDFEDSQPHL